MTQFDKGRKQGKNSGRLRRLRWLPLALLLGLGLALWLLVAWQETGPLKILQAHHEQLAAFVEEQPLQAVMAYLITYTLAVAFSLPIAALLTLIGGYLFGTLPGALLAAAAATTGATMLFLAARGPLAEVLKARAGSRLDRLRSGFREGAFNYLLVLRLIPLFPFWLVNLAAALFGVPLGSYLAATALGMLPASLVYAFAGQGVGSLLATGEQLDAPLLLAPSVLLPLLGLALLAMLPRVYRAWKGRRPRESRNAR